MSTRSSIGVWESFDESKVRATYHHSDGYPSGVGSAIHRLYKGSNEKAGRVAEYVLSEQVGWSYLLEADINLPPLWTQGGSGGRGELLICVRQSTFNAFTRLIHNEMLPSKEVMSDAVSQHGRVKDLNSIVVNIIANTGSYNYYNGESPIQTFTVTNSDANWVIYQYWAARGGRSYWERGESHEMAITNLQDFVKSDMQWVYLIDITNSMLWVYMNSYTQGMDKMEPYGIVSLNSALDAINWAAIESGECMPSKDVVRKFAESMKA